MTVASVPLKCSKTGEERTFGVMLSGLKSGTPTCALTPKGKQHKSTNALFIEDKMHLWGRVHNDLPPRTLVALM
jgi:hypothetical protein